MTVVVHGERAGDRAVGRPHTHTIANPRDPMVAVQLARKAMQAGAWRGTAHRDGDTGRALHFLKTRFPAAHAALPRVAVTAMTKNPPSPGCHWCAVAMLSALSFDGADPYPPRDELTLAFLGNPCRTCKGRHDRSDAIAARLAEYHQLVAAGVPPRVAAESGRRRAPDPPNFQRRPIRWPADARVVR